MVENLTGGDWKDVELSLVSGNPVALKQPLYTAFFTDRPEIPVTMSARAGAAHGRRRRAAARTGPQQSTGGAHGAPAHGAADRGVADGDRPQSRRSCRI